MQLRPIRVAFFILNSAFCVLHSSGAVTINADQPVFVDHVPYELHGTTDAAPGTPVTITIGDTRATTVVASNHEWRAILSEPHTTGTYTLNITIGDAQSTQLLRIQLSDRLQRQSPFGEPAPQFGTPEKLAAPDTMEAMPDRWRIVPPPYELDEQSRGKWDPYNKNLYKGDYPIRDGNKFLVLTGISDTLAESRTLPTPSGVSTVHPASIHFFGDDNQNLFAQNFIVTADAYEGDTTFQPIRQRIRATLIANLTKIAVEENGIVKPDVRRGTRRTSEHVALQELFYERKLRDLTPAYDFMSIRVGEQPFNSDFRGFIFSDTNVGARFFGNYASNRWQYNAAIFERLEKDTNSGLNTLHEFRGQQVLIANVYKQDFLVPGYTQELSLHFVNDDGGLHYDRNGVLARPAPVGDFRQHTVRATYLGEAGLGHAGRINIDQALYLVFGRDDHNPIAARSTGIRAGMAAAEVSIDRDWIRPRLGIFYATGDKNPRDGNARGFDSIFDNPNFAGGGFSFLNRMGIRLAGSGVVLIDRGSLLPSLRSGKEEGQPNYVNPGLRLVTAGVDLDITPRLKTIVTINEAWLDQVEPLEEILFQGGIHRALGTDISLGAKYRPFLSNNWIITGGVAGFVPGRGFKDIYEDPGTLYHLFTNVTLQF